MNKNVAKLIIALIVILSPTAIFASDKKILSPASIPGSTIVDAEGVINLVTTLADLNIIDARIKSDRKQGYIEGSVSLPDIEIGRASCRERV